MRSGKLNDTFDKFGLHKDLFLYLSLVTLKIEGGSKNVKKGEKYPKKVFKFAKILSQFKSFYLDRGGLIALKRGNLRASRSLRVREMAEPGFRLSFDTLFEIVNTHTGISDTFKLQRD